MLRIPIESIYIPLTATLAGEEPQRKSAGRPVPGDLESRTSQRIALDEALNHRLLAVVGYPGSGKGTFVNHVAHLLCRTRLEAGREAAEPGLGLGHHHCCPATSRTNCRALDGHPESSHDR